MSLSKETELNRTNFPSFKERIFESVAGDYKHDLREYPGYPSIDLKKPRWSFSPSLFKTLLSRRSSRSLIPLIPSKKELEKILYYSYGVHDSNGRGPTPSAGGVQALSLYLCNFEESSFLQQGFFHLNREKFKLELVNEDINKGQWESFIPSQIQFSSSKFYFVIVGDGKKIEERYSNRAERFLYLEAGHLMQNLCLVATSLGYKILPLGGFYDNDISKSLKLMNTDKVLYISALGLKK